MSGGMLGVGNHDRDSAGMRYVYPVVSRRSQGVSVGVNLNVNNACNWQCVYCQVPDLKLGAPPPLDMALLENELRTFLKELLYGRFMEERVPEGMRRINDIAISGNGEPTSAAEFAEVVDLIAGLKRQFGLGAVKIVLITNGSLMHRQAVQRGLALLAANDGEVWFKCDRATEGGRRLVNRTESQQDRLLENLSLCAGLCDTWLQTCWFDCDGEVLEQEECRYLELLHEVGRRGIELRGVHLYGVAREPMTGEDGRIREIPPEKMLGFASRIGTLGYPVTVEGVALATAESSVGSVS
jgi:wyosine [tRNA(Phe)-imidazoG37] synthetase (radical SAM superfamily)